VFHFEDAGFDYVWVGCIDDDNNSRMVSNSLLVSHQRKCITCMYFACMTMSIRMT
jgi:hypothetical protein